MNNKSLVARLRTSFLIAALINAAPTYSAEVIKFTTRSMAYFVNGQLQPTLSLKRGVTYAIEVDTPGHPLWIKTLVSNGQDDAYTHGITGNGTTSGTITFVVPADAPPQLFYNCLVHPSMHGSIEISD